MLSKKKDSPKIKRVNEKEFAALLERAKKSGLSKKDCDLMRNAAEIINFYVDNVDEEDA